MKLYFVRHGQTDWNRQDKIQGHADIPLNATGVKQAEGLRKQIEAQDLQFDAIYASSLQRVRKTAEIITGRKNLITLDNRLMERGVGEFEGRSSRELFGSEIDFLDPETNASDYGVEPINDFTQRVNDFLQNLVQEYPVNARILIVSSNGVMKRAYEILTDGQKPPNFSNGEIFEYEI